MNFSYYNKAVKGQDKRAKLALDSFILNSYGMVKGCKNKNCIANKPRNKAKQREPLTSKYYADNNQLLRSLSLYLAPATWAGVRLLKEE